MTLDDIFELIEPHTFSTIAVNKNIKLNLDYPYTGNYINSMNYVIEKHNREKIITDFYNLNVPFILYNELDKIVYDGVNIQKCIYIHNKELFIYDKSYINYNLMSII